MLLCKVSSVAMNAEDEMNWVGGISHRLALDGFLVLIYLASDSWCGYRQSLLCEEVLARLEALDSFSSHGCGPPELGVCQRVQARLLRRYYLAVGLVYHRCGAGLLA